MAIGMEGNYLQEEEQQDESSVATYMHQECPRVLAGETKRDNGNITSGKMSYKESEANNLN